MYVVYALVDPRDNTVRYVGITTDVYQRFQEHINCSGGNFIKNTWIYELRAANKMVSMETLEEVDSRERAEERERYWIHHFEMLREPLVNISKTSPIRRSKRTGLRMGKKIANEIAEYVQKVTQPSAPEPLPQRERLSPKNVEVTSEERIAILAAAHAQLAASGKNKVARQRLIDDQPGWYTKKWWNKVAQVLNEEGL